MSSWEEKMRFESQLSRMNCQTFSTGLSSGHLAGSGNRVMLAGMTRACEPRPPPGPAARDPGLLADPRLVLPPQFYGGVGREIDPDRLHRGGEVFLKAGMASGSCA